MSKKPNFIATFVPMPEMKKIMDWERLISDKRFGLEEIKPVKTTRNEFRRDYDRLIFSSPFRRLQNKTQVFPLPGSIFVHNRLTHSLEVSSVGRSMAEEILGLMSVNHDLISPKMAQIPDVVAAACLAHDLGNPPFGHSGEKAISSFFSQGPGAELQSQLTPAQWADLTLFDGNANAFRVLTHKFDGRRPGGFAMTYATLAAIAKYPYSSIYATELTPKFGFFTSEEQDFKRVATELGMIEICDHPLKYARHPLVYIVEAADDICYEVMDLEDAHKLKWLSTTEVINLLMAFFPDKRQARIRENMQQVADPNEKISYLRSAVISCLVIGCAKVFTEHENEILSGTFTGTLISQLPERERHAFEQCAAVSESKIYMAGDVIDIDIAGTGIISFLMEKLVHAVLNPHLTYSQMLLSRVPEQYQVRASEIFDRIMAVVDHMSGMTDIYALDLYRKINATSLKINN